MVKQGHYASSSRQQRVRQLKQHHQVHADRVIEPTAVTEFLLVRYHLTQGKQQRPIVRKTMQQFLTQWLALATSAETRDWSLTTITTQTLQQFNLQLPWQGYAIINQNWTSFQAFLMKEVSAVPLQARLHVSATLTPAAWQTLLSQQLAVNALLGLFGQNEQQLGRLKATQVESLQASIQTATGIDWDKVASLLAPLKTNEAATSRTRTWLAQLDKLAVADFD